MGSQCIKGRAKGVVYRRMENSHLYELEKENVVVRNGENLKINFSFSTIFYSLFLVVGISLMMGNTSIQIVHTSILFMSILALEKSVLGNYFFAVSDIQNCTNDRLEIQYMRSMDVLTQTGCIFVDYDNLWEFSDLENFDFEIPKVFFSRKKLSDSEIKKFEDFGIPLI